MRGSHYLTGFMLLMSFWISTPTSAKSTYAYDAEKCEHIQVIPGKRLTETEEIFEDLLEISGETGDFYLCPLSKQDGAFASNRLSTDGNVIFEDQYIGYNSDFIQNIEQYIGYWGLAGILAHELAHHLLGHTRQQTGSHPATELEADYLAGKLMQHSGASLDNTLALPKQPFMADGGSTHPDGPDRIEAFRSGWYDGCAEYPTPQCPNGGRQQTQVDDDPSYAETEGYLTFISYANELKGRGITAEYCQQYVDLSIRQTQRNEQANCGYLIDSNDRSRWSKRAEGQYEWCINASAYASEKEAMHREEKLKECLVSATSA